MAAGADRPRGRGRGFERLETADLEQRRRQLLETTMAERIEQALLLGDLARDLRRGMTEALR
ncbi:MAG: hypothetical protein EDQ89_01285 [Acidobacteria bacterium]|nr:MAG: hypothetical protein EDQ89_01285 [Acidobacteriota bacterium]GIK78600.1 MAG: hypothetical protein BroJett022_22900 [Actinomycetes bacterium]